MSQTYDPIRETVELRRLRFGAPLRAPAMGTALVLERAVGDPVVVRPGDRIPDARIGNYRRMYVVDTANRGLSFTLPMPSADPAFPFAITVRFGCRITDPVAIASDGVRDMTAALSPSLVNIARGVAARFDAMQPTAAEAAITAALYAAHPLATVQLTGFSVTANMVNAAEIVTARREIRVDEMRREAMRSVASGGRDEMLAHVMAINGGDPTPVLDREADAQERETRAKLDALKILMGSSDNLEEFNTSEISKQALGTFFPSEGKAIGGKRGGIRDRIERKSLERSRVVEGNAPVEPVENGVDPASDGASQPRGGAAGEPPSANSGRTSRVRGSASGTPRPSGDR